MHTTEVLTDKHDYSSDRDGALKLISWFSLERVRAARVLVVGAGAIGNEVLKNLALLGVGNIYIFDRDCVQLSNLSRSVLYRAKDEKHPKAITAARAVLDLNPNVNAYYKKGDLRRDLGEATIRSMDAVIGCVDSVEARYLLNRLCFRAGRPWIDAGIGTLNGNVAVYAPPDGVCYECGFADDHRKEVGAHPCNVLAGVSVQQGHVPTTPTIASIVAGVQVQEFLKLLSPGAWKGRDLTGLQLHFQGDQAKAFVAVKPRDPDCEFAHESIDPERLTDVPLQSTSTFGAFWRLVGQTLGPDTRLLLRVPFALDLMCSECQEKTEVLKPFNPLHEEYRCGKKICAALPRSEANLTLLWEIGSEVVPRLAEFSLYALGIPPHGIVEVEGGGADSRFFSLAPEGEDFVQAQAQ